VDGEKEAFGWDETYGVRQRNEKREKKNRSNKRQQSGQLHYQKERGKSKIQGEDTHYKPVYPVLAMHDANLIKVGKDCEWMKWRH